MNGPRHNEIPQDDGDDDNPNEPCKTCSNWSEKLVKIRENSGFVILKLVGGSCEHELTQFMDDPTIPQDDGDDDNPNETMCVYFFLPLYAAFIIF